MSDQVLTTQPRDREHDRALGRLLGIVLRFGVTASSVLVIIGMIVFFSDKANREQSADDLLGKNSEITNLHPGDIWNGLRDGSGTAWIQLGLLVLILTPIVRVAVTAWFFLQTRERLLALMALAVLCVLVLGMVGVGLE